MEKAADVEAVKAPLSTGSKIEERKKREREIEKTNIEEREIRR